MRIQAEVWARLKEKVVTARYRGITEMIHSYKGDAQEVIRRNIVRDFQAFIENKLTITKLPKDWENPDPRGDFDEYEAKVIILSLKDAQDILDMVSQLEMEAKFNGNRDGRESISSELFRKLTQPTTQDPDPN